MTRIRRIKVAPFFFDVKYDDKLASVAAISGAHMEDSRVILIDPTFHVSTIRDTLLHEATHALWTQTTLDRTYTEEQEEHIIWALTPRLLGLLRDNPLLVRFLTEKDE